MAEQEHIARQERRRAQRAARWEPDPQTAHLGENGTVGDRLERWEKTLLAERSAGFRLALLAARIPGIRRLAGAPASLARDADRTLEDREARVEAVRRSRLGSLTPAFDGSLTIVPIADGGRPAGFPRIGPALDCEVDAAIALLASVPFEELQRRGWHLQRNQFFVPLNDVEFLRRHPELWTRCKVPADINWRLDEQLRLVEELAPYLPELDGTGSGEAAPPGDRLAYHAIVRTLRPKRVIEIGGGWSAQLLARALSRNDRRCAVTLIGPKLDTSTRARLPRGWEVIDSPVQLVDLDRFEELEAGDVLFFDGSHCMRTGGDVNWVFFEVLPRLAPGVWIHVHNVFWPWDYSPQWLLDEGLSWNEQYLVQAFLMGNSAYRVRLAMGMLATLHRAELRKLLPGAAAGASLWIEKRRRFLTPPGGREQRPGRSRPRERSAVTQIDAVMTPLGECASARTTVAELVDLIGRMGEAVPVVEDGGLLASLGATEVMSWLVSTAASPGGTVADVLHARAARAPRQAEIGPEASVAEATAAMVTAGADHLIVVEGGRVQGVVSRAALEGHSYEAPDGFPLPPDDLMARDVSATPRHSLARRYCESGERTAGMVRTVLHGHGRAIEQCSAVLDFGSGSGRVIRQLAHLAATAHLVGWDRDPQVVAWCRQALPFAEFVEGAGDELEFADASFDLAYALAPGPEEAPGAVDSWLAELARVVKPGGLLLLAWPPEAAGPASAPGLEIVARLPSASPDDARDLLLMARPA